VCTAKFGAPQQQNFGAKNMQKFGQFYTILDLIVGISGTSQDIQNWKDM